MSRKREQQAAILRGVYEDNLRTARKPVPEFEAPVKRPVRGGRVAGLLAVLFVMVAGLAYQNLSARQGDAEGVAYENTGAEASGDDPGSAVAGFSSARLGQDLTVAGLYGLQIKNIVIDAGHGGIDPGAIGALGAKEKEITLDVAARLKKRLERHYGYRILLTREEDVKVSLKERVSFANSHNTDLFISLHVNWLPDEPVTSVETYYFGHDADAHTLRLAEVENSGSDYTMGEFQDMLQAIGNTMKLEESKRLAGSIQRSLYRNMHKINDQVSDWGVHRAPFVVLLGVEAPSVLAEISCISNHAEETKLNTGAYREQLAMFLEEGIVHYLTQQQDEEAITEGATEHAAKEKS